MFKRLQNLLSSSAPPTNKGIYFYVQVYRLPHQPSEGDEVVQVRIDPMNEVSLSDEGEYFVRKEVVGPKTFRRATLTLHFNAQRRLTGSEVEQGVLTDQAAYEAYLNRA